MVEEKPDGSLVTTRETKGLDLVRRDWCTLSREAGSVVLDFILSGLSKEELVSKVCHLRLTCLAYACSRFALLCVALPRLATFR